MAKITITNAEHKAAKDLQKKYRELGIEKTLKECYQDLGIRKQRLEETTAKKEIVGWWFP